jgi:hypothetical protein
MGGVLMPGTLGTVTDADRVIDAARGVCGLTGMQAEPPGVE